MRRPSSAPAPGLPRLVGLGAAFMLQGAAFAHGDGAPPTEGSNWALGLAVMTDIKPYRDVDRETRAIPFFTYENRWVRVFGPGVEWKLGQAGPLSFGLTATYGMDGYKASDSPFLLGMEKRRGSVWLGARAGLRGEWGNLNAEWSGDASSHSKGQKFRLGVERRFSLGAVGITPRLAATWLDRKFVQYYHGVEAVEARPGRPQYRAGATVNTEFGLRLDHRLGARHTVFADLATTALGAQIRRSPLVERNNVPELRLGYLYRF